jgi:hypothetical protein
LPEQYDYDSFYKKMGTLGLIDAESGITSLAFERGFQYNSRVPAFGRLENAFSDLFQQGTLFGNEGVFQRSSKP